MNEKHSLTRLASQTNKNKFMPNQFITDYSFDKSDIIYEKP